MYSWNKYVMPSKTCTHVICDGEYCIVNPIPLRAIMEWKYVSCLFIPILGGFKRIRKDTKQRKTGKIESKVFYMKNVSKREEDAVKLKNLEEIFEFLLKHDLKLTIDLFSFNPKLDYEKTVDKKKWLVKLKIEDFSDGQEILQIPVVNTVDGEVPEFQDYLMYCIFEDERRFYKRTNVCCDCTDNCRDKMKCACFQETLKCYNPDERDNLRKDENIGYNYKLLPFNRQNMSGIYECNHKCQCNQHCNNRVVQYAPKWKFQLFKEEATKEKGWGVRTLNDIPAGAFVSTYTGTMCQETEADLRAHDSDWKSDGKWKYIVNLQVMQNADKESVKIDPTSYEKKVPPKKGKPKLPTILFGSLNLAMVMQLPVEKLQDNPNHPSRALLEKKTEALVANQVTSWGRMNKILQVKREQRKLVKQEPIDVKPFPEVLAEEPTKTVNRNKFLFYNSPQKSVYKIPPRLHISPIRKKKLLKRPKTTTEMSVRVNLTDILEEISKFKMKRKPAKKSENEENVPENARDSQSRITPPAALGSLGREKLRKRGAESSVGDSPMSKQQKLSVPPSPTKSITGSKRFPLKSPNKASTSQIHASKIKGKYSLRGTEGKNYTFKQYDDILKLTKKGAKCVPKIRTSKDVHLIDGRKKGNIGRFFNHSCDPNMFCQYVFVDTHDVRFPVVGFFAKKDIKAGQELTWSYNYDDDLDLGIDPLMCLCGTKNCRGVLIC